MAMHHILDGAGVHGMAPDLSVNTAITTAYLIKVKHVKKALAQIVWPGELNVQARAFIVSLGDFTAALEANNMDDAIAISATVHDAQHALSRAIDDWTISRAQTQ